MRGAALVVLIAACDAPAPPAPSASADPLASSAYAFCHEEGADADQVARWCALLEEAPPDVCPGMRATCASGRFEAMPGCMEGAFEGAGYADAPDGEDEAWKPSPACDPPPAPDAGGAAAALRWGAALLAALVVVALVRLLLLRLGWLRPRPRPGPVEALPAEPVALEGDDDLPALPEDAMLAHARIALDEGRLGDAAVWARGAALRRLARRGRLVLHKARTDREYVRALGADPSTADDLADVLGAVEDHRFAGRVLTEARARAAVAAATRLLAALLLALLLPTSDAEAARRHAPNGDAALHARVGALGWEVVPVRGDLGEALDGADVLVLDVYAVAPTDEDWADVIAFVEGGGTLLLGGRADAIPGLGRHELAGGPDAGGPPVVGGRVSPRWPGGSTYRWCDTEGVVLVPEVVPGVLGPPTPEPLVVPSVDVPPDEAPPVDGDAASTPCGRPALVVAVPLGEGWVVALADAMVLRNAAMVLPANRDLLRAFVGAPDDLRPPLPERPRVVLATWSGGGAGPTPLRSLANARLLPFLAQLLVVWTLVALAVGWPLSPPREDTRGATRAASEHASALGRHWARVGATRRAAAAVARLELARHGPDGLLALARRAGETPEAARALVARAEDLAADPDGPDGPDDIDVVEALWKLTRRPG